MEVTALLRALGTILSGYDDLPKERAKTESEATVAFGPRAARICAVCGRSTPQVEKIAFAHIVPLEEGGTTSADNLIPLCEGTVLLSTTLARVLDWQSRLADPCPITFGEALLSALDIRPEAIGCHKLFDSCLMTRRAIRNVRERRGEWGGFSQLRGTVFEYPLTNLGAEYSPTSARRRTVRRIMSGLAAFDSSDDAWYEQVCKLISASRRTSAQSVFHIAQYYCKKLDKLLQQGDRSSAKIRARVYYEKALVSMAQQPDPDLRGAVRHLERSCWYAKKANHLAGWAMSRLEWVHAKTFSSPSIDTRTYQRMLAQQDLALAVLTGGGKVKGPDEIRWVMNALEHRAQLQVKARRIDDAAESLGRARDYRDNLTVVAGWTKYQAIHMNTIHGAIAALQGHYDDALRLLSRALIPMRVSRGKRPEGYLDVARCAAWTLGQLGRSADTRRVRHVAREMRDGRSGFWPYW